VHQIECPGQPNFFLKQKSQRLQLLFHLHVTQQHQHQLPSLHPSGAVVGITGRHQKLRRRQHDLKNFLLSKLCFFYLPIPMSDTTSTPTASVGAIRRPGGDVVVVTRVFLWHAFSRLDSFSSDTFSELVVSSLTCL